MAIVWKELGGDKIPACMYQGNDGDTLNVNYPYGAFRMEEIKTSKGTADQFTTYKQAKTFDSNNINVSAEKLLDCDWLILLLAGGSTTSGAYNINCMPTVSGNNTRIDFNSFKLGFMSDNSMDLMFKAKHKIIQSTSSDINESPTILYYAKVDKEKSSPVGNFTGKSITKAYMNPAVRINVSTSSYMWYQIQAIPLINE